MISHPLPSREFIIPTYSVSMVLRTRARAVRTIDVVGGEHAPPQAALRKFWPLTVIAGTIRSVGSSVGRSAPPRPTDRAFRVNSVGQRLQVHSLIIFSSSHTKSLRQGLNLTAKHCCPHPSKSSQHSKFSSRLRRTGELRLGIVCVRAW